jgi:DNA-binding transcriptional regulator YiaG
MRIADEVKSIRSSLGITQAELGRRLGVTSRAVRFWEAGSREPGGPALIMLKKMKPKEKA